MSVIIAARNAASTIGTQLLALVAQRYPGEIEIIVADNASTDGTAAVVEQLGLAEARIVPCSDGSGSGFARNRGAATAAGEVLLFCDADDEVGSGWLRKMASAALVHPIFGGDIDTRRLDPLAEPVDGSRLALPRDLDWRAWGIGCNLGVRREVSVKLGGWNEAYRCAEDVELSWRAALAGYGFTAVDTVVHYRPRPTARAAFRQGFAWGRAAPRLKADFERHGFRGRGSLAAVGDWWRLVRGLGRIASNAFERREAARLTGLLLGRVVGSARWGAYLP